MSDIKLRGQHPWLNFAAYKIKLGKRSYLTSEHLFQALKTTDRDEHEYVRRGATPRDAKARGREVTLRKDWEDVKFAIMVAVLLLKFTQNKRLREQLLATQGSIVEDRNDPVWGVGRDGKGKNLMGDALMKTRDILNYSKGVSVW